MVQITQGLYEVLTSERLTKEQKKDAVRMNTFAVYHLDGEHEGRVEPPKLANEDAEMICEAIDTDSIDDLTIYSK